MPAPIDWGLAFAWSHKRTLCLLAVFPTAVDLGATYLQFTRALQPRDVFLLLVCSMLVNTWLLQAVLALTVEHMRRRSSGIFDLLYHGWAWLPKVFFSYVALLLLVMLFALFPLLAICIFFFVWAPLFCAAEQFAPEAVRPKRRTEDEADDLELPSDTFFQLGPETTWFKGKAIWHLGILRSVRFARENWLVTVQIIVMLWCAHTIPTALVEVFGPPRAEFSSLTLQMIFSSLAEVIVLAAVSGIFLRLLPAEAKAEIGIERSGTSEPGEGWESWPGFSFVRKKLIFVLLTLSAGLSTFYILERIKEEQQMPRSVAVTLQPEKVENGRLVLDVRLIDEAYAFRWLDTASFILFLGSKPPAAETEDDSFLKPDGVIAYADDGSKLADDLLNPHYGPLRLVLYYALPGGASAGEEEYSLYYRQTAQQRVLLHKGKYKTE